MILNKYQKKSTKPVFPIKYSAKKDSLAYNPELNSFAVVEYKKARNFSIVSYRYYNKLNDP